MDEVMDGDTDERPGGATPRSSRRAFLGLAGGGAAALGAGAVAWGLTRGSSTTSSQAGAARTTTTTAPLTLKVTTDTRPPLPIPAALPDPNAPEPDVVLGTIALPTIGIEAHLQEGIALASLDRGPGHWPGTALPGQLGNLVVAGHRVTYTHPFRDLDRLRPGDPVVFVIGSHVWTYRTRGTVVVPADAVDIAAQSYAHTATLFACHPPGQAIERIVAKLRLVDHAGRPVDADTALPPLAAGSQSGDHVLTVSLPAP
jgi:LPXTG-site transpeptidase (sortase) family protein